MRVLAMLLSLEGGLPPFAMALLLWFGGDWRLINRRAVLRDALAAASALTIVGAVKVFSMPLEAAFLMVGGRCGRAYHGLAVLQAGATPTQ
jgi:hypothetical protein